MAAHTELYRLPEGIEFYDRHRIRKSSATWLTRKPRKQPSVITGWLLLLNLIVLILAPQIAISLFK
jgi:hypothetical protein